MLCIVVVPMLYTFHRRRNLISTCLLPFFELLPRPSRPCSTPRSPMRERRWCTSQTDLVSSTSRSLVEDRSLGPVDPDDGMIFSLLFAFYVSRRLSATHRRPEATERLPSRQLTPLICLVLHIITTSSRGAHHPRHGRCARIAQPCSDRVQDPGAPSRIPDSR
jgi:hypothetical protein